MPLLSASALRPFASLAAFGNITDYGANLHTAKIATLGERVEDTFLISGSQLDNSASRIRLESELLERLAN